MRISSVFLISVGVLACGGDDDDAQGASGTAGAGASGAAGTAGSGGSGASSVAGGSAGTGGSSAGTGGSGTSGSGGSGALAGTGGSSGSGGTSGSGGVAGTGAVAGSGGSGGNAGSGGVPVDCDIITQNCGDPSLRCYPTREYFSANYTYTNACIATGDKQLGDSCTLNANDTVDDCAAGLFCFLDSGGSNPQSTCVELCEQNSDCSGGKVCASDKKPTNGPRSGVCLDSCTLFDNTCAQGTDCRPKNILTAVDTFTLKAACTGEGPGAQHDPCRYSQDCGEGLICDSTFTCAPLCDMTHGCDNGIQCLIGSGANYGSCLSSDWSCVSSPMPPLTNETTGVFTVSLIDSLSGNPIAGVTVSTCDAGDPTCSSPSSTGQTDSQGQVDLTIPLNQGAFNGFFLATASGYLNKLIYPSRYKDFLGRRYLNSFMLSPSSLNVFASVSASNPIDTSRGVGYFVVNDCSYQYSSGVYATVENDSSDASTKVRYFSGALSSSQTSTSPNGNTSGMIFNVLPSDMITSTFTALDSNTMMPVGSRSAWILPNTLTFVAIEP